MDSYAFGVEAVLELIGAPEDVRRFDAALIVASSEVDPYQLKDLTKRPPVAEHLHTSELCRELILWAWTRTHEEIDFEDEARDMLSDAAAALAEQFDEAIPLVDRGSMRYKLARLATALAMRTFSSSSESRLLVRVCHVEYIVAMLERVYSASSCGYRFYTDSVRKTQKVVDVSSIKLALEATPFPADLREHLLYADVFDVTDVSDWCGWEREQASDLISLLVRKRAVRRNGKGYNKTSEFIVWLKSTELNPRPEFVKEKF